MRNTYSLKNIANTITNAIVFAPRISWGNRGANTIAFVIVFAPENHPRKPNLTKHGLAGSPGLFSRANTIVNAIVFAPPRAPDFALWGKHNCVCNCVCSRNVRNYRKPTIGGANTIAFAIVFAARLSEMFGNLCAGGQND